MTTTQAAAIAVNEAVLNMALLPFRFAEVLLTFAVNAADKQVMEIESRFG